MQHLLPGATLRGAKYGTEGYGNTYEKVGLKV